MFKKIVCAIDGSQHALRAAEAASGLAVALGAELIFLTVTKRLEVNDAIRRYMEMEHLTGEPQYVLDEMTERFLTDAQQLARDRGITGAKTLVRVGNPARAIVAEAKRLGADLVVMGRRGHGDIEGVLMGSVSHKVSSISDCTVMTVK